MNSVIKVSGLSKSIKGKVLLNQIDFEASVGEVIGVVGLNGAGKSTFLKSLLGLTRYQGKVEVCGLEPKIAQHKLTEAVSFIADTATLPKWITAEQLLDYMAVMHPNFQPKKAREFLSETNIDLKQKVKTMSKGMVTQLHLALISAIRSRLLILDEPTIGLDILRRKKFYQRLLEEYFDQNNTVLITSHQVEEIEHILTRVVFIDEGKILLDLPMDELASHFCLLHTSAPVRVDDQEIEPLSQESGISGCRTIFRLKSAESVSRLKPFGQCTVPSLADLFVALQDAKQMNCEDQKISGECHV